MEIDPVALAAELVRAPSVTPQDHGCQEILIRHLERLGFAVHRLRFGAVENFYARLGAGGRNLCFAGHTDVVGPGDAGQWRAPPFAGRIEAGELIGRGICDMKGGIAAMVAAVAEFLRQRPGFAERDSLSFLITGDEEGDAVDGTIKVMDWLEGRGERLDYCLVGEPTALETPGDCIKNGRRGSLNGTLRLRGVQGHVAYPHRALNPIHAGLAALDRLARHVFDAGNPDFEPSSFQFTGLEAGDGSTNVIPGEMSAAFNIRFNTEQSPESLEAAIRRLLDQAVREYGDKLSYTLETRLSGLPFRSPDGPLLAALQRAAAVVSTTAPTLSTGGGTSDARFLSRICAQTFEMGLVGQTMHKVDERCPTADLEKLSGLYLAVLAELFP